VISIDRVSKSENYLNEIKLDKQIDVSSHMGFFQLDTEFLDHLKIRLANYSLVSDSLNPKILKSLWPAHLWLAE